jgi:hypothetical protein
MPGKGGTKAIDGDNGYIARGREAFSNDPETALIMVV